MRVEIMKLGDAMGIAKKRNRIRRERLRRIQRNTIRSDPENILLAVTPAHADCIRNGSVTTLFRKTCPALPVKRIFLYETHPVNAVRTIVDIRKIQMFKKEQAWTVFGYHSFFTRRNFEQEFQSVEEIPVYCLGETRGTTPLTLSALGVRTVPKQFFYIGDCDDIRKDTHEEHAHLPRVQEQDGRRARKKVRPVETHDLSHSQQQQKRG